MRYLITGGAGFIGSHLVERLLNDGHKVTVLDNFSMGKMSNLPKRKKLKIYQNNILGNNIKAFTRIQTVFHLAALTRPRESFKNPLETFYTNVNGTLKVMANAYKCGVRRVVFVSSATVYGHQKALPMKEDISTSNPESPYGLTKETAETYTEMLSTMYKIKTNIVRPFNVYGKRQDPNGPYGAAIPKFINYLKKGKQPYITGDGEQFRDFIYIDDLVELFILASKGDVYGEIFNGGSGETSSVNDLYKLISKIMKKEITPEYVKEVKEPNTLADISKSKKLLNWEPKISLEEGLKKVIYE